MDFHAIDACTHDKYRTWLVLQYAATCVGALAIRHTEQRIRVQKTPSVKVIAEADFPEQCLTLVPATNDLSFQIGDPAQQLHHDIVWCPLPNDCADKILLKKPKGNDFTAAIWKCKVDTERSRCNCEVMMEHGVFKPPMSKESRFRAAEVQCVVNFQEIKSGDEIVIFKAPLYKPPALTKRVVQEFRKSCAGKKPRV